MKYDNGDCPETDDEMYAAIDEMKKPKVKLLGRDGNAFAIRKGGEWCCGDARYDSSRNIGGEVSD